jgi:hypothetical protein
MSATTYSESRLRNGGGRLGRGFRCGLILSISGASKEGRGEDGRSHSYVEPHDDVKL